MRMYLSKGMGQTFRYEKLQYRKLNISVSFLKPAMHPEFRNRLIISCVWMIITWVWSRTGLKTLGCKNSLAQSCVFCFNNLIDITLDIGWNFSKGDLNFFRYGTLSFQNLQHGQKTRFLQKVKPQPDPAMVTWQIYGPHPWFINLTSEYLHCINYFTKYPVHFQIRINLSP